MRNLIILGCTALFVMFSCKNNKQIENASQSTSSQEHKITTKDIEQLKYTEFALSDLSEAATKDWLKFHELQSQIEILKKGDLSFFKDDKSLLVALITDLKKEIPETANTSSITVRISVLETTLFKLEGLSNLKNIQKTTILKAINGVLIAHSNLILQINKKFEKDSQNIKKPS